MVATQVASGASFCMKSARRVCCFAVVSCRYCVLCHAEILSEADGLMCNLGAKKKWKSWNIIVIQADSGESRTFADDVEPGSEPRTIMLSLSLGTNGNTR